jgi:NADPH:quinone reductase-like Zn-dependent oxidoreductase
VKAAILESPNSVPVYGDFAEPGAGPDTQVVELVAAGIHHVTRSVAADRHYGSNGAYPLIPGLNAVARTADGQLVFTSSAPPPYGTFAERIASPGAMRFPLPDGASPEAVAAGRSRPGLDRAAAAGAEAVAVTGDRDADADALASALGGDAPGLVLDFVWGPVAETAFGALGRRGLHEDTADIRYVQIGALAGAEAAVPSALLRSRKLTISGSGAGSVPAAEIRAELPRYLQLIADGSVQVPFRTFPLSDVAAAWTASAESGPRVVLVRDTSGQLH